MIVINLKDIIGLGLFLIAVLVIFLVYLYDRITYSVKKKEVVKKKQTRQKGVEEWIK